MALSLAAAFAIAGCSSSSSGPASDGGDDGPTYYGSPPSDASTDGEGGGGDAGPDGPTCVIPASATISQPASGGGIATCSPQVANGECDSLSFRLKCTAPNPNDVPQPPSALMCNLLPNGNDPATLFSCCACAAAAPTGGDP
jgi:hypothetical protein